MMDNNKLNNLLLHSIKVKFKKGSSFLPVRQYNFNCMQKPHGNQVCLVLFTIAPQCILNPEAAS